MLKSSLQRTKPRLIGIASALGLIALWLSLAGSTTLAKAPTFRSFHTPSGNIGCYAYGGTLRCDIGQKSWRGPRRPAWCRGAYDDSLSMTSTGRPTWSCHSDTALRSGQALAYGTTWHSGPFACTSRIAGLTCTNRTGHGFFLSRQSYRRF